VPVENALVYAIVIIILINITIKMVIINATPSTPT
jgi:hypothetical protein